MPASPGGQEIGRVSVKVLPDTSKFAEKARRQLYNEAKKIDVTIKVQAEIDQKSLDHIRDQLRNWHRKVNPIKVEVKPELAVGSTTLINARLNYMSRMRRVPIVPYLSPPAVKAVATGLAALSGARVIGDLVEDFQTFLRTLDKTAPALGLITQGLVGIVGLGLTAGSNLFALSAALAQIGAVALTLPATAASAAIGVGVLIAAFKDFNKVLPEVKGKLSQLQNLISGNFWEKAKKPIQDMIGDLFPRFSKGLGTVSTELGGFFASLANSLSGSLSGSVLAGMFKQLGSAIEIASHAAKPLADIIAQLGQIGAAYLPRMAQWVVLIASRFDNWLAGAISDGSFQVWVDNGLRALSDLGQVLKNLGGIFNGIAKAATEAGGSGLNLMAQTLERVNKAVNSPAFQTGLTNVLAAAHEAMQQIGTISGPAVEKFFAQLGTTLTALLPIAGKAIGTLVEGLASAMSNPAFVNGFTALVDGVGQAIQALAPALTPLGAMFGTLGSVLGTFLASIGPLLATALVPLAAAFQSLLPALQPVIGVLTGALTQAFTILTPIIMAFGTILSRLVASAMPVFQAAIAALLPVISQLAPIIGDILLTALTAITPLFPLIAQAISAIVPLFAQLVMAVLPLVSAILPALSTILQTVIPIVVMIAEAVLPPLIAAVTALVTALVPVIAVVAQVVSWLLDKLAPVLTWVAELIVSVITGLLGGFTDIFSGIMGIWEGFRTMFSGGWSNFLSGLLMVAQGIWNIIKGAFNVFLNIGILGVAKKGLAVLKGAWKFAWDAIKMGAKVAWAMLKGAWNIFLNGLKTGASGILSSIKTLFSNAWNAVLTGARLAFGRIAMAVAGKLGEVVGKIRGLGGRLQSAMSNASTILYDTGAKIIRGLVNGISSMFGAVKGKLTELTGKLTSWKGPESLDRVLLVHAGQLIIDGLIRGLESRYTDVRDSLQGLTKDIGSTVIPAPKVADLSGSYTAIDGNLASRDGIAPVAAPALPSISVQMESNSSPEDVADAILFAQKRYRYGSAYAQ